MMIRKIRVFLSHYTTFLDRLFILLVVLTLGFGFFFLGLNEFHSQYPAPTLFATQIHALTWAQSITFLAFSLLFLFYGIYIRKESPHAATFIWGMGLFAWGALSNIIIVNGVQSTPFPPIDAWLVKADAFFGINIAAMMAWSHEHPLFNRFFDLAYNSLGYELFLIPIGLAVFNKRRPLAIFFISYMISLLVGDLIYYFFPTMAPSGILHSPYFLEAQQHTSQRFYQVHHFLPITAKGDGGLIAFPSYHVIWAVLLTYTMIEKKLLFYPLVALNTLIIISTMFLGWHYFSDVISGIVLAIGSIGIAAWVYRKSSEERGYFTTFKFGRAGGGVEKGGGEPSPSSSSLIEV
ncbi:MAG: hypothetical protein A3E84_05150 [Gammaproteobacteria bacterium RIFCSPHIGHO2_12_FULL_42_13]|nr:MAG: hypothetical protein A3E84_05150 [Gammaproteobacteria bacterium RIFCSPHIGHO2_12_FULL_42_13]